MALNNNEFDAVCGEIRAMLTHHIRNPFDLIREQSVVSEVYFRLRSNTKLLQMAPLTLSPKAPPGKSHRYQWNYPLDVNRVQCEMRISEFIPSHREKVKEIEPSPEATENDESGKTFGRIDLVVLRKDKVCLEVEKNGPGDVIKSVSVDYIDASLEFKACPLKNQWHKVCNDLQDLYEIQLIPNPRQPLDCFLVFLDKTQGLYGNVVPSTGWWKNRSRVWPITQLQNNLSIRLKRNVKFTHFPSGPKSGISALTRSISAKPRVWIFVVDGNGFKEYVLA